MIGTKIFLYYIIVSCWPSLLAHSQECKDPVKMQTRPFPGVLYLGENKMFQKKSYLPLPEVRVYELSHTPMVQYVVLMNGSHVRIFQPKEPYHRNSAFIKLRHNSNITVGVDSNMVAYTDPSDINRFQDYLKTHGTTKEKAFEQMKTYCNLLVLQEKLKNEQNYINHTTEYYLRFIITLMLVYCIYFFFNCLTNYWALRKVWRKQNQQTMTFAFYSLSQSLTNSCLSKYYMGQNENLYQYLYERIASLAHDIQKLHEQIRVSTEIRKVSVCTYDYADSVGRPPQPASRDPTYGYIGSNSVHDYITVLSDNFMNIDRVVSDLKVLMQTYAHDAQAQHHPQAQHQTQQRQSDPIEYKTIRSMNVVLEEDVGETSQDDMMKSSL